MSKYGHDGGTILMFTEACSLFFWSMPHDYHISSVLTIIKALFCAHNFYINVVFNLIEKSINEMTQQLNNF